MSNHSAGHDAEERAAQYLVAQGFKILDRNWQTRLCEIDIVAQQGDTVYLIEVKYRRSSTFGQGLDYITPKKLKQMQFAAELWVQNKNWTGPYQLAVVSVDTHRITFIDQL